MTNILQIENLSISFHGGKPVVKNLNLSLKPGKTLAIVGESGSGKSVTSLALMGLLPNTAKITANTLEFLGTDLRNLSDEEYRKLRGKAMTMIFQEPMTSLNPAMKCGRQLTEILVLHDHLSPEAAKKECISWFEKVRLPDPESVFNKYPHQLSGGQRQRVMIAMAMCTKPKLLIADEPTTALDVTVQKNILQLLRDLQKEMNMAMLFITHDLGVVKEIADEVLVMYRGEVKEHGAVADVIGNPQDNYTKGLLACRPPLNEKPRRLKTVEDFMVKSSKFKVQSFPLVQQPSTLNIQSSTPILKITNLHKFFTQPAKGLFNKPTQIDVLKGITLEVFKGETLGLVGESGCGKSTLGRSIIRLLTPEEGEIIYKGQDITHLKGAALRKLRKEIQLIFQDPYSSLNPKQTVGEAIVEPMTVHKLHENAAARKERAIALLEKVGLTAAQFNRYPHEFSGGQRQRIGIARALAVEPELIICDESVSALDVSVQAQVLNLLNDLKDEFGLTYIFISHDLSVVKYFSDRVAVMNKGEIVELNTSDEIYKSPQNEYTKTLLAAIPGVV